MERKNLFLVIWLGGVGRSEFRKAGTREAKEVGSHCSILVVRSWEWEMRKQGGLRCLFVGIACSP